MSDKEAKKHLEEVFSLQINRRNFLRLAGGMAAGAALASCQKTEPEKKAAPVAEKPKVGGTLIYGMESESDILDPHSTGGWITARVTFQMFEGLAAEDLRRADVAYPPIVPGLATEWQVSDGGKTYVFKLRKGVKFHDDTPFDAEAVKFNYDRMMKKDAPQFYQRARSYCNYIVQYLASTDVVDSQTVKFTFKEPFAEWLPVGLQSMGQGLIISPTALKKYGNQGIAEHPVGTGPFKFVERIRNEKIILERNNDYWGPKPYLDKIVYRPFPDAAARLNALLAGECDMILCPPPDSVQDLKNKGYTVSQSNAPHVWYFWLNMKDRIVGKLKVRQAIQMAVDREKMAKDLLKGTAKAAGGIIPPGCSSYDPAYNPYPYDSQKAKQLLAEAGYPNGFETILMTSVDGSGQMIPVPMAEWIQRDLAAVGIKVKLETYEWITYLSKMFQSLKPGYGGYQLSWGMTTNYWIDVVSNSKRQPPDGVNIGNYANPKVDKLLLEAQREMDETKRIGLYRQIQKVLMEEDAAFWPIVNDLNTIILAKKVKGFINPPEEWFQLSTVWIES